MPQVCSVTDDIIQEEATPLHTKYLANSVKRFREAALSQAMPDTAVTVGAAPPCGPNLDSSKQVSKCKPFRQVVALLTCCALKRCPAHPELLRSSQCQGLVRAHGRKRPAEVWSGWPRRPRQVHRQDDRHRRRKSAAGACRCWKPTPKGSKRNCSTRRMHVPCT